LGASSLGAARWADRLVQHYRRAMQLEVEFFGAQPYRAPPRPISLLVVDFDDTCTASDSTGLVMQTAIEATVAQADGGEAQSALRGELQGQLQWLVANYSARRQGLLEEILPEVGAARWVVGGGGEGGVYGCVCVGFGCGCGCGGQ
jgi:hypothetical protein